MTSETEIAAARQHADNLRGFTRAAHRHVEAEVRLSMQDVVALTPAASAKVLEFRRTHREVLNSCPEASRTPPDVCRPDSPTL